MSLFSLSLAALILLLVYILCRVCYFMGVRRGLLVQNYALEQFIQWLPADDKIHFKNQINAYNEMKMKSYLANVKAKKS